MTPSPSFLEEAIDVANALRLVAHNARAEGAVFAQEGSGMVLRGVQCRATLTTVWSEGYVDGHRELVVRPHVGNADGFEPVTIVMRIVPFLGSSAFDATQPRLAFTRLAAAFDPIQKDGEVRAWDHLDEPFGVLVGVPRGADAVRAADFERLCLGFDATPGSDWRVLTTHPALGAPPSIEILGERPFPFDGECDDDDPMAAAQVARAEVLAGTCGALPDAVMVRRTGKRVYDVSPLSYTRDAAPDPGAARRAAVRAFDRLSSGS